MAEKTKFNRRDFLKIVGAGAGMAASGCGKELPEKFIPYVIQPDEVIPGVAVWYSGTCGECTAGCGTLVRTREGRAVKVEGNPNHPLSKGGLCAHGQATMQALYDPDRVREPLKRDLGGAFQPIAWKDAIDGVAQAMADATGAGKEVVLLTPPTGASELALIEELSKKIPGFKHLEYELSTSDSIEQAAELVFGPGMRTTFDFAAAKRIVSFGADFLESWISPVEFSRGWAEGRKVKSGTISEFIHFEPRLSLTAANADVWVKNAPGSDIALLLALLSLVTSKTNGGKLSSEARSKVQALIGSQDLASLLSGTSVDAKRLEQIAEDLVKSGPSLVIAGGASVSGAQAVPAAVLANLINAALGNVGTTVRLMKSNKPAAASYQRFIDFIEQVAAKTRKVGVLLVAGANPSYTLPQKTKWKNALANIETVVALSMNLDETANQANMVLPLSHQIESWKDSEPSPGLFDLSQPAMQPLYKTQSLGDTLVTIAANSKLKNAKFEGVTSFYDYIRLRWKERTGEAGFEARWLDYVEKGGDWSKPVSALTTTDVFLTADAFKGLEVNTPKAPSGSFSLLVYPSIQSFDGKSANRAWLQELPDPITSAVWGSWVELHPDAAETIGVATGDVVQVYGDHGFVETPAYVTKHIHPSVVAIPLGQGHESLGRYANGVGVNALSMLPPEPANGTLQLLAGNIKIRKAMSRETLVRLQGSDSQRGRGIARTVTVSELAKLARSGAAEHGHGDHGGHPEGHVDPMALGPKPLPKQMYEQMPHELLPYRWGMSIDLNSCTGCSACVVACNAENNIAMVGKTFCNEGREMSWLRIERFLDGPEERPVMGFVPMLCQHCANAPCEPVCPVYATYHTEDGLNAMTYNRCVGTRYCLNNCSYKVRRFNWFKYAWAEPLNWQLNPDVTVREVGVMEKCTFCVQRIREGQSNAKDLGRMVLDGEIKPACVSSCPTSAMTFGNLNDHESQVYKNSQDMRSYKVFDVELNTQPAVSYLAKVNTDLEGGIPSSTGTKSHESQGSKNDAHAESHGTH